MPQLDIPAASSQQFQAAAGGTRQGSEALSCRLYIDTSLAVLIVVQLGPDRSTDECLGEKMVRDSRPHMFAHESGVRMLEDGCVESITGGCVASSNNYPCTKS